MRKQLALVLCILLIIPFVSGCGESLMFWKKKGKEVEVVHKKLPPFEKLFNRTVELYNTKHYKDAIQALLFLRENYPRKASYQSRITLYLADSHYQMKEYPEAIANYEEFIKLYPRNPDVSYAYFQIGMCNYAQRRTYDRDASFVRKAIQNFEKVIQIAPPGVLVNESIRMIAFCQRELVMHEFFIADFYMRTHHYRSALFRYEDVLHRFSQLKIYDRAHLGIAMAYLKMRERNKAFRHLSFVAKTYPNSPYGKKAWKLLQKDFKVASVNELPDVTFPAKFPVEIAGVGSPSGTRTQAQKAEAHKKVGTSEKKNPALAPGPKKVEGKEKELARKPHVYLPKISKIEKETHEPARASVPVAKSRVNPSKNEKGKALSSSSTVEKPAPGKKSLPQRKVAKHGTSEARGKKPVTSGEVKKTIVPEQPVQTEAPTPSKRSVKTTKKVEKKPAPKPVKKAENGPKAQVKSVKAAPPAAMKSTKPEKTASIKSAPSVANPEAKSVIPVSPVKKVPVKSSSPGPTPETVKPQLPKPPVKTAKVTKKTPPQPSKKAVKPGGTSEKKTTVKPEKMPQHVKKVVKTDRLPPKKKEGSSLGPVGTIDTRLPIHISSDHVEAKQGKHSVRFYGNVIVKQRDVMLKCKDLTAYYTADGKAIDKIIAHGKVAINQRNKKVTCGKAIFYNAERKIVLEDSPTAWDGDNKLSGDKMILLLDKNEIQIIGTRKKPTELVIYPEKE